ncbi:MAG TPA: hypothetical protein VLT45_03150 [Kofleriaceae bacterium]|nr:hypothetical protein [Kofleriaceae bacterium]
MPDRPAHLRLPLQTGAIALFYMQCGLVAFVVFAALAPTFAYGLGPVGLVVLIACGVAPIFGGVCFGLAWRERPSDVIIDDGGFAIRGGPVDQRSWAWGSLLPGSVKAVRGTGRFTELKVGDELVATVTVMENAGAFGSNPVDALVASERESLESTAAVLDAWPRSESAQPIVVESAMFRCASCSAPLEPADRDAVVCAACGHATAVPERLRTQLRSFSEIETARAAASHLITRLVHQPRGSRTTALGSLAGLACLATLPVFVVAAILRILDHPAFWHTAGMAITGLAALWIVLSFVASGAVANRAALRAVVLGLRARAPSQPGSRPRCRACNAELPPTTAVLEGCLYCGADNVLLADLRTDLAETRMANVDLSSVLTAREAARGRRWWMLAVRGGAVALLALWMI